jgi:hypothetical protein
MAAVKGACTAALALSLAFADAPAEAIDHPDLAGVVAKADTKCLEMWQGFRQLVAEEHDIQRVFGKSGKVQRVRRIRSDYYIVQAPSARPDDSEGLLEFRDVLAVESKPVRRDPAKVFDLLTKKGSSLLEEQCRILTAANQHNLLFGSGLLINFTAGLAGYIHKFPEIPTNYHFAPEPASGSDDLVVCFEEGANRSRSGQGPCMSQRPMPGTGCVYLDPGDFSVRKVEVTLAFTEQPLRMRLSVEYEPGPGGMRLPSRRTLTVLHPKWKNGVAGEAVATYSNFRRFSSEARVSYEPIQ